MSDILIKKLPYDLGQFLTVSSSYSQARAEFAQLMNRVTDDREGVVVKRRDHPAVAMIAAGEFASLMKTAHLLRSPANAARLLAALVRSGQDTVSVAKIVSVLRREVGLDR